MLTLSIVLLVRHTTGSYGTAGAVAAVTGVSMALCAPLGGRLADRFGQRRVLVPGAVLHALSALALTALALAHAPVASLFATAAATGACVPQIGPMVRARWARLLGNSPLQSTATAFESVTDELTFVLGPLLATALCTTVDPAAGLIAEAALTLAGGLLFAAQRATEPTPAAAGRKAVGGGPGRTAHGASALRSGGVRLLAVAFLGIGTVFGGMQVSLAAFTESIDRPGLNGVLYGIFAAGNMLAGLLYGAVAFRRGPEQRLVLGYAALTLAASALWAADSVLLLAALGLLVGSCVAPAIITGYTLVERLVPAASRTEAFTWLTGAVALGQALAVTLAGQFEDRLGQGAGFLVPLGGTALALALLLALRTRLAAPAQATASHVVSVTAAPSQWTDPSEYVTMDRR
ncbi:MFS transporter [Streptomyces sp. NA04227]|nr:MFS transporter [Streptomyces sp. NA04227]